MTIFNPAPSSGGSPGGSNGDIQYNNSGSFGGTNNATLDSSGNLIINTSGSLAVNGGSGTIAFFGSGDSYVISASENFGVNTSSPQYPLDVNGDIADSTSGDYFIGANGDSSYFNAVNGGNVGIGTNSPQAQLDVTNYLRVIGPDGNPPVSGQGIEMTYDTGGTNTGYMFTYDRSGPSILNTNVGDNNQLLLTSGGPIAIGNSDPIYALDINDNYSTGFDIGNSTVGRWNISNNGSALFANVSVPGVLGVQGPLVDASFSAGSAGQVLSSTGTATKWITTLPVANGGTGSSTALGIPLIVGNNRRTGLTAAQALTTLTVGASDTTYQISVNVNITAVTIASFTVTCTYTDETNTSRTLVLNFSQVSGTLVQTLTAALGAGAYEGVPLHIRAKAGTTIIIASAAGGTYTSITYNLEERIMQL
jgi:hypothetical protein